MLLDSLGEGHTSLWGKKINICADVSQKNVSYTLSLKYTFYFNQLPFKQYLSLSMKKPSLKIISKQY
jgi:hypothetical protein